MPGPSALTNLGGMLPGWESGGALPISIGAALGTKGALQNRAWVTGNPSVTTPISGAKVVVAAAKLTTRASGIFVASISCLFGAIAGDQVTFTVETRTDSVFGVPMTLSANAAAVGTNCFAENDGHAITFTNASAAFSHAAPQTTMGPAGATGLWFSWGNIVSNGATNGFAKGSTCCLTLAIADAEGPNTVTQLSMSLFELV